MGNLAVEAIIYLTVGAEQKFLSQKTWRDVEMNKVFQLKLNNLLRTNTNA